MKHNREMQKKERERKRQEAKRQHSKTCFTIKDVWIKTVLGIRRWIMWPKQRPSEHGMSAEAQIWQHCNSKSLGLRNSAASYCVAKVLTADWKNFLSEDQRDPWWQNVPHERLKQAVTKITVNMFLSKCALFSSYKMKFEMPIKGYVYNIVTYS